MSTFPQSKVTARPGVVVLSGPAGARADVIDALAGAGSRPEPDGGVVLLPHDPRGDANSHGLPSHANELEAASAGVPNAGHTPGTGHPESGHGYVADPRISFVTVALDDDLDRIVEVADRHGWRLRMHTSPSLHAETIDPVRDELVDLRQELDYLRRNVWVKGPDGAFRQMPPPLRGGAPVNPPYAMQTGSHTAQLFRQAVSTLLASAGGTVAVGGLATLQHSTGAMSVDVAGGVANGQAWVAGTTSAGVQGLYYCYNDATQNLAVSAANATNPRIDTVVAQVEDAQYAGAVNAWKLAVVAGTPTNGATLVNLSGKGSVPASSLVLAYVRVASTAERPVSSVLTADILYAAATASLNASLAGGFSPTVRVGTTGTLTNTALAVPSPACTVSFVTGSAEAVVLVSGRAVADKTVGNSQAVYGALLLDGTELLDAGIQSGHAQAAAGTIPPTVSVLFHTGDAYQGVSTPLVSGSGDWGSAIVAAVIGAPVAVVVPLAGSHTLSWAFATDASGSYVVLDQILDVRP